MPPSPQAILNRKERERIKKKRKRERRKAEKRNATTFSKTSAEYRRMLPEQPEMSKDKLRAMLAEAVRNTK